MSIRFQMALQILIIVLPIACKHGMVGKIMSLKLQVLNPCEFKLIILSDSLVVMTFFVVFHIYDLNLTFLLFIIYLSKK